MRTAGGELIVCAKCTRSFDMMIKGLGLGGFFEVRCLECAQDLRAPITLKFDPRYWSFDKPQAA